MRASVLESTRGMMECLIIVTVPLVVVEASDLRSCFSNPFGRVAHEGRRCHVVKVITANRRVMSQAARFFRHPHGQPIARVMGRSWGHRRELGRVAGRGD